MKSNIFRSNLLSLALAALLLTASGCTQEDSGDDSSGPSGENQQEAPNLRNLRTSCGTVFNGEMFNPIESGEARRGTVRAIGPNMVAMKTKRGEDIIKLHGIEPSGDSQMDAQAEALIAELSSEGEAYFYLAEPECTFALDDGQEGLVGHLFSARGKSFGEQLIRKGLVDVSLDICRGSLISSCYRALAEEAAPTPTPFPIFQGPPTAKGFMLWKPVSDNDGRLAIHTVPYGTSVRVIGETGSNHGPGNGYGSLARFRRDGCDYGRNVKVELILSDGSKHMFGDKSFAVIPDGCSRWLVDPKGAAKRDQK